MSVPFLLATLLCVAVRSAPAGNSCTPVESCIQDGGKCINCIGNEDWGPCTNGNEGFRHKTLDQLVVHSFHDQPIVIDGNLKDWEELVPVHKRINGLGSRDTEEVLNPNWYEDIAFADMSGEVRMYETYLSRTKYCGPKDFKTRFALGWDQEWFYIALAITDATPTLGDDAGTCWKTGVQLAFEIGGEQSQDADGNSLQFHIQGKRQNDLDISRLRLLNLNLPKGHNGVCRSGIFDGVEEDTCCVHYAHDSGAGWAYANNFAVRRDDAAQETIYEMAISRSDLMGDVYHRVNRWRGGLVMGFSWLVNDGDKDGNQGGWAGYYPHSIVEGWNGGDKEPWKLGSVIFNELSEKDEWMHDFEAEECVDAREKETVEDVGGGFVVGFVIALGVLTLLVAYKLEMYCCKSCPASVREREEKMTEKTRSCMGVLGSTILGSGQEEPVGDLHA